MKETKKENGSHTTQKQSSRNHRPSKVYQQNLRNSRSDFCQSDDTIEFTSRNNNLIEGTNISSVVVALLILYFEKKTFSVKKLIFYFKSIK